MPTLCAPTYGRAPRSSWLGLRDQAMEPQPRGPEGSGLTKQLQAIWQHLGQSSEARAALILDEDQIEYRPMPAKRSFEMMVHLEIRGRGRPVRYQLDDDLGK